MDNYKTVITAANSLLKGYGYNKKGTVFYLSQGKNWGLIGFQKSRSSTKEYVRFTINVGVSSGALRRCIDEDDSAQNPDMESSHWQCRIGSLMPGHTDHWWELNQNDTDEDVIFDVIRKLKDLAIPAIQMRISDSGLIDMWKSSDYGGTTLFKKYVYLTTLLKLGKSEELPAYIEEFINSSKGTPFEVDTKLHINVLEKIH
ncbi:DUF4304 domain-containing protein [Chitinophaga sp. CC14]|uniref:DUF4304 domain-containing protein n=1 Tax=Chitinophaga sp. CC14 TaxID=3029199 RepID=UPI003B7BBDBA